jgi:hypothetical protein
LAIFSPNVKNKNTKIFKDYKSIMVCLFINKIDLNNVMLDIKVKTKLIKGGILEIYSAY